MILQILDNTLTLQVKQVKTLDKTYNNAQACDILLKTGQILNGFFFGPYELYEILDTQLEHITARPINAHTNQKGIRDTYTKQVKVLEAAVDDDD